MYRTLNAHANHVMQCPFNITATEDRLFARGQFKSERKPMRSRKLTT